MPVKANRVCRIFLAALILFLSVSAAPSREAAGAETSVGMIVDGVWRLDPGNYTYKALQKIKTLNLSGRGISAIEGIEYLGSLTSLDLSYNNFESLDLSKCNKLTELNCSHNRLGSLDIRPCGRLKILDCSDNPLGELNTASAKNLQTLDCRNCGLKTLDTKANTSITELYCSGNELSGIDVGHLRRLKILAAAGTGISTLDLSRNGSLTGLDCSSNPALGELDLKANTRLRELHTDGTAITALDLTAQRDIGKLFGSRNGYRYEAPDGARTWRLDDYVLTINPETTVRFRSGIVLDPDDDEERNRGVLPGYLSYTPGNFTQTLLGSSYDDMVHYFSIKLGPNGNIFHKADEGWFYENAHTVVKQAGLAVQFRREETDKEKSSTMAFTVFDGDGHFRFKCTLEYMANEDAIEFAKRLNADHESGDGEDLWGYTGQVTFFACGNALVALEGIPSMAYDRTPTIESYITSNPTTQLYLID